MPMTLPLRCLSLALLLAAAALPATTGQQGASPDDVLVTQDTTWTLETKTIPHDLVVQAPATLRLEGVQLTVGDHIDVQAGARLELGPSGDTPTRITALDATVDETHGFWMQVNGTLTSSGTPRTELSRTRGSGLNNLYFTGGGIQVVGRAELADFYLHDGNGTLIADQGGSILLERAELADLGFLGLGALGPITIRDSHLHGSDFALMGKTLCDFRIEGSRIEGKTEAVMVNGCPANATDSSLQAGVIGVYASGGAKVDLRNVDVGGYRQDGIYGKLLPNERNPDLMEYPRINVDGVRLAPSAEAKDQETHGFFLMGSLADIRNATVTGHRQGIVAKDNSLVAVQGSSFVRNRNNAIVVTNARISGDLLGNDFGGLSKGNLNGVPILSKVPVRAVVTGEDGQVAKGTVLRIFAAGNSTPIAQAGGPNATYAKTDVLTHSVNMDLQPTFLGPFTYEVTSPLLSEPVRGQLDLSDPAIVVPAGSGGAIDWTSWPIALLMGLGIVLVLLGMLPKRFLRFPKRRSDKPTTPS